ncbi:recombinase-like helix-turn-helix domain-containing protein [Saccharopolyspora sp. NPDC049426]|uniref:recombinase-like helix-turn-helix domain-containing protein n=1 Tax=Saccharopolyspora sp. NPDC049426 TaxID=3155652 RepID=UPI00344232F7
MSLNLEPVQTRLGPTTSYADAFGDELEAIYGRGVHDLPGVVAALNEAGVRPADGSDWTEQTLTGELAHLGAKEI